jgi:tRNA A-37 threonylcarbamoyl transferase component Bud32/uncharacterized membrane protein YidH (DUF202 family)
MSEEKRCAQCGAVLAADAPHGLCPACLLKRGFASSTGASALNNQGARTEYVPPPAAELAQHFPELEILGLVGRGGMGVVYKARQKRLDRLVALKILPPNVSRDAAFSERFTREAKALARLTHPNIVTVHDFGQTNGLFYFVMEFVDGMNLRQLLDTGKLSPKEALAIVPQICDALQYAHDKGIVHRDIKPENILIDKSGVVKIADFGLAKIVGLEAKDLTITSARDVIGTPLYMAPEQIEHPQDVDHRADIYSLGVVFYQMLTGELPIGRFAPPSRKVHIDVRLDEVVLRALEKEPEHRYQHASDVKTQVETILTTSAPLSAVPNVPRPAGVYPWWVGGVDYKSKATLWGLPLVHVATGFDPATGRTRVAKGIIAIGSIACGVLAFGGVACGGIAFGGLTLGALAYGGIAAGVVSVGGLALALVFAIGGLAVGAIAVGGVAVGHLAYGGAAVGTHSMGATTADPIARQFFEPWVREMLRDRFQMANFIAVAAIILMTSGVPLWLQLRTQKGTGAKGQHAKNTWKIGALTAVVVIILAVVVVPLSILTSGQANLIRSDYIGQTWFPKGDSIDIESVVRTADRISVRGRYSLVSHDTAVLALYITATNNAAPEEVRQRMQISKGAGYFDLVHTHLVPGLPHVSMYADDGHPFAALYFGTKAEALEESQASWITNRPPASAGPKVISVSPEDGATNLDVNQELRVRFDQPMNPNDMGINWLSGGFLPDGQPRYEPDRDEFVIPVRLIPGQTNDLMAASSSTMGGFRTTNRTYAGDYRWHFTTKPVVAKPGAVKPSVVQISPPSGETLPVLTLFEISFDQPMRPPDQGFPYLKTSSPFQLPAQIPSVDYDPSSHRFTVPVVLPPDNDTKLTLEGFTSADGVASDPIAIRCQIGTNSYSGEQLNLISTAAKDSRLEQLLSSMKASRARLHSGVETVQWTSFYCRGGSFRAISVHSALYQWQGTNQVYADISDIMNLKAFILGSDGKTCWLYADDHNGRRLDSSPAALVADIYTPIADAFTLTTMTVAEAIAKGRLMYQGQTQLDGRTCHRVQSWMVRQPHNEYDRVDASKLEWWIDAETLLPVQVVNNSQYARQTFRFHYEKLNEPLPDTAFQPPATTGTNARKDAFKLFEQKTPAPDEKRFLRIEDGSNGEMSGRIGRRTPGGTTSSGLN